MGQSSFTRFSYDLINVNDLFCQFIGRNIGIRKALTLFGDPADVDGFFRTVLHTAQAADAIGSKGRTPIQQRNVPHGADPNTGTAADTSVVDLEFFDAHGVHLGKCAAFESEQRPRGGEGRR